MISCQRHLFDIPEDVAYLNCAFTSPLLKRAASAGQSALAAKAAPWTITPRHFFETVEACRSLFGKLVGCASEDVAIIPAVSYGIALAAKNLPVAKGQTIIVLEGQFPSNIYSWRRLCSENGAALISVPRPSDNDWTSAVLEKIDQKTGIAALSNCHWTDGTLIDLAEIGKACRQAGAALVIDAVQSLGAMPFSVKAVQPDFLVTAAHKWLLGPYSFGFCYAAPKWQNGIPLEENWLNRLGSEDFSRLIDYRDDYRSGAKRFDVGEVSNFILSPIAKAALEQLLEWGTEAIAETLKIKTDRIAEKALEIGFKVPRPAVRSPHMLGISVSGSLPKELLPMLVEEKVFVSVRGSAIRISPHLHTTDEDIERLFAALKKAARL
jgi:selenocysteine lyase/cysteine desulfurase